MPHRCASFDQWYSSATCIIETPAVPTPAAIKFCRTKKRLCKNNDNRAHRTPCFLLSPLFYASLLAPYLIFGVVLPV